MFKKSLKGSDFADGLVLKVSQDTYEHWEEIETRIQEGCQHIEAEQAIELPERFAPSLIVAGITIDLQAVKTARHQSMFMSLQEHVVERLSGALGHDTATELLAAFQESWDNAISRGEEPVTFGVATVVYDLLYLPYIKDGNGKEFQSPRVLMILSEILMNTIGFTKFALEHYRVKK